MPARPAPLSERIAPSPSANLLRLLGNLYNEVRDLGETGEYISEWVLPDRVFDMVRVHLLQYCDAASTHNEDVSNIVWNGIKLTRKNTSQSRERYSWITVQDIQAGFTAAPRVGNYLHGRPISRFNYIEDLQGYEVFTLERESRNRLVGGSIQWVPGMFDDINAVDPLVVPAAADPPNLRVD